MTTLQLYAAYLSDCRLNYIKPMRYSEWKKARGH